MFLQGHIIEFLDTDQLRMGYVRKQDSERLHVIDPRGRNLKVNEDHVVIVHGRTVEDDFPALAREIAGRIDSRRSDIDVELLWQSVNNGTKEFKPEELTELFFAESPPEAVSALFQALANDSLFFKRKGSRFLAKTSEQVVVEQTRRLREHERQESRKQTLTLVAQLARNRNFEVPATPAAGQTLDRIQNWLRHRTGDEIGSILEDVVGATRAREAAYDILVRTGRVDSSHDRFLVMAGIDPEFSTRLLETAAELPAFVRGPDRVDLSRLEAVTIDDEDTLEIDDALTVERSGSEILVGIHIADVSAFVSKGDALDVEAARRCSTIYLPTGAVRMFPERLSTDLASLVKHIERPAFTVEARFDDALNFLGYRILSSAIRVERRLDYDEADRRIAAGDPGLQLLHSIATRLQQGRSERGAITLRRPEIKIRVHDGDIQIKTVDPNSPSRTMVSEMMILANGLAADFASANHLPVIFRTQEPREVHTTADTPTVAALVFDRLRKTFKRSRLSLAPGAHSGLGLTAYTQASSPIRRYADLVTQRQFTALLHGTEIPYAREELLRILAAAETAEQDSRSIENRSTNFWILQYLSREKMGQPLGAVVLDQKGNIELDDLYFRSKAQGARTPAPGEAVRVTIESVDPAREEIRFKYVE